MSLVVVPATRSSVLVNWAFPAGTMDVSGTPCHLPSEQHRLLSRSDRNSSKCIFQSLFPSGVGTRGSEGDQTTPGNLPGVKHGILIKLTSCSLCLWLKDTSYRKSVWCLNKWIVSEWYNFQSPSTTLSAIMHSVTDRRTDANSRSYPVTVRSANSCQTHQSTVCRGLRQIRCDGRACHRLIVWIHRVVGYSTRVVTFPEK